MLFKYKGPNCIPPLLLNGVPLDSVSQFKYLRHIIYVDLRDDNDIERKMLVQRVPRCSVNVKIALFRAHYQSFTQISSITDFK